MRFERNRTVCVVGAALALGAFCAAAIGDEVTDRSKDPNLWAAPGGDQALTQAQRPQGDQYLHVVNCTSSGRSRAAPCAAMKVSRWSSWSTASR